MNKPRLILAGLSGGAGKTILTLGLCRAWKRQGYKVKPFKKGPDYIDAAWLGLAAKAPSTNLDPFLVQPEKLPAIFWNELAQYDVGVVEGNRGIFDGKDLTGSCSTAEISRILDIPLILIVDCTKMTRTVAALVKGVKDFEPDLNLAGVILNRTAGDRHRAILKECVEHYTGVPVMGCLPKIKPNPIPERHMGLTSDREYEGQQALETVADIAEEFLDLDAMWLAANKTPPAPLDVDSIELYPKNPQYHNVPIGYIRDDAFWFYYQENLEALRAAGANMVELSLLDTREWPDIYGLYLGGGFPETLAAKLAENTRARQRVRSLAEMGAPVYAECGGFMYLGESITYKGETFPMSGVFPVATKLLPKPQGLGYVESEVVHDNPFFKTGSTVRGHEFHYSRCIAPDGAVLTLGLKMQRGEGLLAGFDGLIYKNTFAAYTHVHALGAPEWAPNFVDAAARFGGVSPLS